MLELGIQAVQEYLSNKACTELKMPMGGSLPLAAALCALQEPRTTPRL